jgi:hypothetical protein
MTGRLAHRVAAVLRCCFAKGAAVGLQGWPLLVISIMLALGGPAACVLLWGRVRGLGALPARLALILVCQITAILAVGVVVNDHFQFFSSWSDLSGQNGADAPIEQPNPGDHSLSRPLSQRLRDDFRPSGARCGSGCRRSTTGSRSAASRWWSCSPASRAPRAPGST